MKSATQIGEQESKAPATEDRPAPTADPADGGPSDANASGALDLWTSRATSVAKALSAAAPFLGIVIVAYALASGRFSDFARLIQGYKITQVASIEEPASLGRQTFRDFKFGIDYKTFTTSQSQTAITSDNADSVGDVLAWRFHVQGYAAANYVVNYDDLGGDRPLHGKLCEFAAETTDDNYMVCVYWVPPATLRAGRGTPRIVTVWLDRLVHGAVACEPAQPSCSPVAVRSFTILQRKGGI